LRYDRCVRCREKEPPQTFCLCTDCYADWKRSDPTICACCDRNPSNPGRELCTGCYESWCKSVPEEIWQVPPGALNGFPLVPDKCPCCRIESTDRPGALCYDCQDKKYGGKNRLCVSCGRKKPAPFQRLCIDCIRILERPPKMTEKDKSKVGGPYSGTTSATIHNPCPLGTACTDFNERHLSCFSHKGVSVRKPCSQSRFGKCTSSDPDHIRRFVHGRPNLDAIPLTRCNLRDPTNPLSTMISGVDSFKYYNSDLMSNSLALLTSAYEYVRRENRGDEFNGMELNKIVDWFYHHRCVIYCSPKDLLFAIKNGGFRSTMFIKGFWDSAEDIASAVITNPLILATISLRANDPGFYDYKEYVTLLVKNFRTKKNEELLRKNKDKASLLLDTPKITSEEVKRLEVAKGKTKSLGIDREKMRVLEQTVETTINESAEKLLTAADDFDKDDQLRLKYSISCRMGPSPDCTEQCAVILKESIVGHPDFFMHPVSAVTYLEGISHRNSTMMNRVPYLGESKKWDDAAATNEGHLSFNREKLSPALPFWAQCMAYEWIARVHATTGKDVSEITLADIRSLWNRSSNYCLSEAQLPQIVDRHYWDRVVISKGAAEYLNRDDTGKQFFKTTEGTESLRHVILPSDNVKEVGRKVTEIMEAEGPTAYYPRGFTFGMDGTNYFDEVPIPIRFPPVPSLYIYFTARSEGTFDLIFSNICDYYDDSAPRITQTIRFYSSLKSIQSICLCSATDQDPIDTLIQRKEKCDKIVENFSKGIDSQDYGGIHYCVCLDFNTKSITVSHSGLFYQYCSEKQTFPMPDELGNESFHYVSFCNAEKDIKTTIWNLCLFPDKLEEYDYNRK